MANPATFLLFIAFASLIGVINAQTQPNNQSTFSYNALAQTYLQSLIHRSGTHSAAYASLQPPTYDVQLTYTVDGFTSTPPPCNSSAPGSSCLPIIPAGHGNTILINYNVFPNATVNSTAKVNLMACFGQQNTVDRAWRKPNPIISQDKQCTVKIATGLPPTGNFTYTVGANTAPSVYKIQLLEVCADGSYCGMGQSPGYYQVDAINSRPTWLVACAGSFAAIGPLCLIGFFLFERRYKKIQ